MDLPVRVGWDGLPIPPDPKEIYSIHDWSAVEEAVRLFSPDKVDLAIHPDASLRFANDFIKEFKSGPGAEDGYLVINPEIAYCKAQVFHSLNPHVKALGDWAESIGTQIKEVGAVVGDMISKYDNAAYRNILPIPCPKAQVHAPIAETQQVYLQVTSERGLDLIAAPAKKHIPVLPEKCTTAAEMASAQPSEAAVQTELYKKNLLFLQEKLKLLGSFEDQVKRIHHDMNEMLLGNTSLGSARTVIDFVDVDLMKGNTISTGETHVMRKSQKRRSVNKTDDDKSPETVDGKSLVSKQKHLSRSVNKTDVPKSPKCSSKKRARDAK